MTLRTFRPASLIQRFPLTILTVALLISLISLFSALRLDFTTEVLDLLPAENPEVKQFQEITEKYETPDYLLIVVEARDGETLQETLPFVDAFAQALDQLDEVLYVDYKLTDALKGFYQDIFFQKAFLYLDPDKLQQLKRRLSDTEIRRQVAMNKQQLLGPLSGLTQDLIIEDPLNLRSLFSEYLQERGGNPPIHFHHGYYLSDDRAMLLIIVKPTLSSQELTFSQSLMNAAAKVEAETRADFPIDQTITIGYTGAYPISLAYASSIRSDVRVTFMCSLFSVLAIFAIAFRRWDVPFLVGIPLLMAITWSLGVFSLFGGKLNIVTSAFCAIMVGLGIDYAIHIINHYGLERSKNSSPPESLNRALAVTGRGIVAGALTTALAFLALGITQFRGLTEFGIMSAFGIFCSLVAMLLVLPALLLIRGKYFSTVRPYLEPRGFGLLRIARPTIGHPWVTIILGGAITCFFAINAFFVEFDDNFRHLRPQQSPPIDLQQRVISRFGNPLISSMVVAEATSEDEVMRRGDQIARALEELVDDNVVHSYQSLRTFLPPVEEQEDIIRWLEQERQTGALDYERIKSTFAEALREEGFRSYSPFEPAIERLKEALYVDFPIRIADLRNLDIGKLINRYISTSNEHYELITYVFPEFHPSFDLAEEQVIRAMEQFDGVQVIGMKSLGREIKRVVRRDLFWATILAFVAILAALSFYFGRPKMVLLTLVPLLTCLVWLLGTMGLLGIHLNLMNIAVLPIILGIGIDDGIHIVHHYRLDPQRKLMHTVAEKGRAILTTSLTTALGFGSLVLAQYQGLRSTGIVALFGILYALVATITLLPALLRLTDQRNTVELSFERRSEQQPVE